MDFTFHCYEPQILEATDSNKSGLIIFGSGLALAMWKMLILANPQWMCLGFEIPATAAFIDPADAFLHLVLKHALHMLCRFAWLLSDS